MLAFVGAVSEAIGLQLVDEGISDLQSPHLLAVTLVLSEEHGATRPQSRRDDRGIVDEEAMLFGQIERKLAGNPRIIGAEPRIFKTCRSS